MTRPRPEAESIRARLRNRGRETGEDFQLLLTRFALERLLYRLSISEHAERFVLKGAMLFALWAEPLDYRATKDLDLLGRGSPDVDGLVRVFRSIISTSVEPDDGLDFDPQSVSAAPIREDAIYDGVRVNLVVTLARARLRLQVDVGFGDAAHASQAVTFPTLLDLPAPEIVAYLPSTVVAEKLEAMVSLGIANSRMKDFFDIRWMAQHLSFSGAELTKAIGATFERRGTPVPTETPVALSDVFGDDQTKQAQWSGFVRKQKLVDKPSLPTVIKDVRAFVWSAVRSVATGKQIGDWEPGGPWSDEE